MSKYLVWAILILALVVVLAGQSSASKTSPPPTGIDYELEPLLLPDEGGPAELLLRIKMKPGWECDSAVLRVIALGGLGYSGPERQTMRFGADGQCSTKLSFNIPPIDTSSLLMYVRCPNCSQSITRTFITTGDHLTILDFIPEPLPPPRPPVVDYTDSVRKPSSTDVAYPKSADTVEFGRQPTAEERRLQMRESRVRQMHEMETEPLTELEAQVFTVDSVDYIRYRGETKFHVVVPIKDPWEHSRMWRIQ